MAQSSSEHGNFYWNELVTREPEKAKKFYGAAIGWTFDAMPMPDGTYWVAKMGDKAVGGLFTIDGPQWEGVPEHWMSYLAVDDVDARPRRLAHQPLGEVAAGGATADDGDVEGRHQIRPRLHLSPCGRGRGPLHQQWEGEGYRAAARQVFA